MDSVPSRQSPAEANLLIRRFTPSDVPALLTLIDALADYENLARPDEGARERLARDAAVQPPRFSALLAERSGKIIGYAIYFETYSTFLAQPTLYLEDIFVLRDERRGGVGRALMRELAREAIHRGCGRMEWQVLTWNAPAIAFYEGLNAKRLDAWHGYRLTSEQFPILAE